MTAINWHSQHPTSITTIKSGDMLVVAYDHVLEDDTFEEIRTFGAELADKGVKLFVIEGAAGVALLPADEQDNLPEGKLINGE